MADCNESTEKSRKLWEEIADDWNKRVGENDNQFHREIIRPATLKLLKPEKGDFILDAACGNGNFSRFMAEQGAKVVAFDYSEKMIEYAKIRCKDYLSSIEFTVADATKFNEIIELKRERPFCNIYDKIR